jgi:hypothetical protein
MSHEQWPICLSMQKHPDFEHSHHTTGTLHPADRQTPSCTSCNCRIFRNKLLGHDTDSWKTFQKKILTLKQSCGSGWFSRDGYVIQCDNRTELNAKLSQPCWHFRGTPGSNCGTANASQFMAWYVCGGTANGFRQRLSASCKGIISTV